MSEETTKPRTLNSAEEILSHEPVHQETFVDVSEWFPGDSGPVEARVRCPSAGLWQQYQSRSTIRDPKTKNISMNPAPEFSVFLAVGCCYNDDGKRVFTMKNAVELSKYSAAPSERIDAAIMKMLGKKGDDTPEDTAGKNSPATPA
jgi:hypothetical protein